jgi:hypothetical protein
MWRRRVLYQPSSTRRLPVGQGCRSTSARSVWQKRTLRAQPDCSVQQPRYSKVGVLSWTTPTRLIWTLLAVKSTSESAHREHIELMDSVGDIGVDQAIQLARTLGPVH